MTEAERREMVRSMIVLSEEINARVQQPQVDPGQLMRLMAVGVAQCLVAQAAALNGGDLPVL